MVDHTDDAEVIRQCIWAVVNGPFFPDWRFHALFGFYRDEIRRIAEAWPNWDDNDEQRDAINNTLNNLISGPHDCWDVWHNYISATGPSYVTSMHDFAASRWTSQPKASASA